jgi:hypothetical protein
VITWAFLAYAQQDALIDRVEPVRFYDAPAWMADPMEFPLQKVEPHPIRTVLLAVDDRLAGPRASPVLRDAVAPLDAYYTMLGAGFEPTVMPDLAARDRGMDALTLAGGLALSDVVNTTLARDDGLMAFSATIRGLVAPTLVVSPKGKRPVQMRGADPRERNARLANANFDEIRIAAPPPPRMRVGTALRMREIDDDPKTPFVDLAAFIGADRIGLRSWRIGAVARSRAWEASIRQPVAYDVSLTAQVRSADGSPIPGRATVSLVRPFSVQDNHWQIRAYATDVWTDPEMRVGVELRAQWGWRAPISPDRPLPGSRWDREGPVAPGSTQNF